MHSPEWNTEEDRPYSFQNDSPLPNLDQVSERKRQRSPEGSSPCSPPHTPAHSPVQDRKTMAQDAASEIAIKEEGKEKEPEMIENINQSDFTPKVSRIATVCALSSIETTLTYSIFFSLQAAFLGLQPFVPNKNKGYRPISFNPPGSKIAPPVN